MPFRGVANITCVDKTEPLTDMSFRANAVSRGIFPSGKFYLVVVLCQTWWIPPLRLRDGRNDIWGYVSTNSPTVSRAFQAVPPPHQSGLRPASFPGGEALVPGFGVSGFFGNSSVLSSAERHIGRSLHTLTDGLKRTTLVAPKNCQLSIVHCQLEITVNSQLAPSVP